VISVFRKTNTANILSDAQKGASEHTQVDEINRNVSNNKPGDDSILKNLLTFNKSIHDYIQTTHTIADTAKTNFIDDLKHVAMCKSHDCQNADKPFQQYPQKKYIQLNDLSENQIDNRNPTTASDQTNAYTIIAGNIQSKYYNL
ncbi:hypothetical protein COBT_002327, partial [Conglomerata obtusa]